MRKYFIFTFCVIVAMTLFSTVVLADETMDRIEKTGKLRVGFREDSIPFAFIDPKVGKQVGFSVDMTYGTRSKALRALWQENRGRALHRDQQDPNSHGGKRHR